MVSEIAINGRFLTQRITGVQRYAREVLRALDQLLVEDEIDPAEFCLTCFAPPSLNQNSLPDWKKIRLCLSGSVGGNAWEQVDLARLARGMTLFSPGNIGPVLLPGQIVTIHDAGVFAVPEAYSIWFRMKYRLILGVLGKTAAKIITVSEFSKRELMKYCGIPAEKITVIPHGSEHLTRVKADRTVLERYNLVGKTFLLLVGSESRHKNMRAAADALEKMKRTGFELVMVGGGFQWFSRDGAGPWPDRVRRIGYASDGELRALYEHAVGLVFPSIYEGFGLPVVEAMALGCPVICSRSASIPEVGGDAVLYFNADRPDELRGQVERLLGDPTLRDGLRVKGEERARGYQWKGTARATWMVIEETLGTGRTR